MSILRGIQSAIFFYLSCAPCYEAANQRRRKKEGHRDRAEKRARELEQPDLYRHPDPSSTNPYWNEEIALGPGPPPRKGKGAKKPKRNLTTASTFNSTSSRRIDSSLEDQGVVGIQFGDPGASDVTLNDDTWNKRRYQREDEELWGTETVESRDEPPRAASSAGGSSVGLVGLSRPDTSNSYSDYYVARPAPVNDLHPPVVSMPSTDVKANQWMLQPPPSAKIMSGKQISSIRSRSGSQASSRVDINLGKEISQKKIEEKLKRGETPELPPLSRGSSFQTPTGQRESKSRGSRRLTPSPTTSPKQSRLDRTSTADSDASDDSLGRDPRHDSVSPLRTISGNVPKVSRPKPSRQLSTVHSEESVPTVSRPRSKRSVTQDSYKPTTIHKENVMLKPVPRPTSKGKPAPLTIRDSSLNLLQDLVSPSELLNSHFIKSPTVEARIGLPPTNSNEELALRSLSPWFPSDDFAAAADETDSMGRADPSMRWSMDI